MDGEFFYASPKGRTTNYHADEYKLLCLACKKISHDPVVCTEKPMNTYWKCINEFSDARNTSGNERLQASLCHRWSPIFKSGRLACHKLNV